MEPAAIFWSVYSFFLAQTLWDLYLSWRQYQLYVRTPERPALVAEIISDHDYAKARDYKLDKFRFGFFSAGFSFATCSILLLGTLFPWAWNLCSQIALQIWPTSGEIWHSLVYFFVCSLFETVVSLPLTYYDTFYIEQKHGFNKETVPFFFKDRAKKFVLSIAISAPIIALLIWIIRHGGQNFHIYAWAVLSVIIFVLMFIYPEFIAPLFDKYTPLPDSELKQKIEALASKVQFPLTKIYVVEGSKRSTHSNAYMYGFWKNKRIVLYDTLLSKEMNEMMKRLESKDKKPEDGPKSESEEPQQGKEAGKPEPEGESTQKEEEGKEGEKQKMMEEEKVKEGGEKEKRIGMEDDEVVAVLGHELGHWKLYHSIGLLAITEINLLIMLFVFSLFYKQANLYLAFGFQRSEQPILIGLMLIGQFVLAPYTELLSVLMNVMSRKMEFAADRFSAALGHAPQLCKGLIKLGKDNLSVPIDDWLYSWCNHSHPPIPERMEALKKYK